MQSLTSFARGLGVSSSLALGVLAVGASCKITSSDVGDGPADAGGEDVEAGDTGARRACAPDASPEDRTFDPSVYDRACTVDGDCTIVTAVAPAPSAGACQIACCSPVAVRATATVSTDRARLAASCCSNVVCTRLCPEVGVACVGGQCVTQPDAGADAGADAGDGGDGASDAADGS
jgi:hypothetical protein